MANSNRTYDTTRPQSCVPASAEPTQQQPGEQGAVPRRGRAARAVANERRHVQVIEMLADGRPLAEIEAQTGYRPRTIRQIAQRYRAWGPAGLVDGRQRCMGAPPLLSAEQQSELREALQNPAPNCGVWTGPKVAQWIAAKTGKVVHRQRGWEYLRRLGMSTK